MELFADLHLHSRFARACSKDLGIETMEKWARIKGTDLLGTGDFTHPLWQQELKRELTEVDNTGVFATKTGQKFLLQTEISQIYTDLGRGRKIHNLLLCPNFEVMDQITEYFLKHGRVDYDGRPIFKISCPQLVEDMRSISSQIEIIPAHIWTPWFSLFGSNSGWDSIKDCFKDQTKHIHALETGLSSDPAMNWRISELDRFNLVSFSDSHSYWPWRYGREATVFSVKENFTYADILAALRKNDHEGMNSISHTIEVDPNYGKYHFDGHRNCGIRFSPKESRQHNEICPKCNSALTLGVEYRVEALADREVGFVRKQNALDFKTVLPLSEILSVVLKKAVTTKTVWNEYWKLVCNGRSENDVLFTTSFDELSRVTSKEIAAALLLNRQGKISVEPGYDGVYGQPVLGNLVHEPEVNKDTQKGLQDFLFR